MGSKILKDLFLHRPVVFFCGYTVFERKRIFNKIEISHLFSSSKIICIKKMTIIIIKKILLILKVIILIINILIKQL